MAGTHFSKIKTSSGTVGRIGASLYGACASAANTVNKSVTMINASNSADSAWDTEDVYMGLTITVRFTNGNTAANPTLNVNGTGNKPIYRFGTDRNVTWDAGAVISFTYDTILNSSGAWVMNDFQTYPIGSVIITATNTAPTVGGTWQLFDKGFRTESVSDDGLAVWNTTIADNGGGRIIREGHRLSLALFFSNKTLLNDSAVEIVRVPLASIGIVSDISGIPPVISNDYFCDGANTIGIAKVDVSGTNLVINHQDVIPQNSSGITATGNEFYLKEDLFLETTEMLDSFCDKFYWKRIS